MPSRVFSRGSCLDFLRPARGARTPRAGVNGRRSPIGTIEALESRIAPAASLAATKVAVFAPGGDVNGDGKFEPGDTILYTVTLTNNGTIDLTGVTFADVIDGNTTLGAVNVSPIALDDTFTAVANTLLEVGVTHGSNPAAQVAGGVFGNDQEFLGDTFSLKTFEATSAQGGSVAMDNGGHFSYLPAAGFTGTDTFHYTITDKGLDGIAGNADDLTSVGTVTITVKGTDGTTSGPKVWYVDSSYDPVANGPSDGRSSHPFTSLAPLNITATDPDGANDVLYIRNGTSGTTPYTGGITLEAGQMLHGEADALTVNGFTLQAAGTAPTLANVGGTIITLATNNTLHGFTTQNANIDISGSNFGTLNVSNLTISGTGKALDLATGTLSATFNSITVTSSPAEGIKLSAINGTLTASSGSISSATGDGIFINGGTGSVTFGGAITSSTGHSVDIINKTGGTVNLDGAINDTGTGILLSSNTGATIHFTGGITASTGANKAFSATGGGTIDITGSNNTLATTTATALEVQNTTISATGLNFKSINTSGSSGNSGIILNNTGSLGGLTVTGTGTTAGSGGTISNKTADGISLTSTSKTSLANMIISSNTVDGISGTNVTDFAITGSTLNNNGSVAGQHGIKFTTLLGTSSITNTTISGSAENNLSIDNTSGTLTQLTISGSTFKDTRNRATGNDGFLFQAHNSAIATVVVTNSSFTNNALIGAQFQALDSSTVTVTMQGNTFTDNNEGLELENNTNGKLTATIGGATGALGNSFSAPSLANTGNASNAILVSNFAAATSSSDLRVKLLHNNITIPAGAVNHGVIVFGSGTSAPLEALLDSNTITNNGQFDGIHVNTPDTGSTPAMNVTITNNTVNSNDVTGASPTNAINVNYRRTGTGTFKIENNTTTAANGGFGIQLRQTAGTVQLERGGSASNTPATVLGANNPGASGTGANISLVGTVVVVNNGTIVAPLILAPDPVESVGTGDGGGSGTVATTGSTLAPVSQPTATPQTVIVDDGVLSQAELDSLVAAAIARWEAAGITPAQDAILHSVSFSVSDLPGWYLGEASAGHVVLDASAAGNSWFLDPTPNDDSEFAGAGTKLSATANGGAAGRVDALTTVMHELGHQLGLDDTYASTDSGNLMYGFIHQGERRLPALHLADGAMPHLGAGELDFAIGTINIGSLPVGKSVQVVFNAQINSNISVGSVSNQGTAHSTETGDVLTDDPGVVGAANPTVTQVTLPNVSVAIGTTPVLESSATGLVYTFSRDGGTTSPLAINFGKAGTAIFGSDYTVASSSGTFDFAAGTLTIPAGSATATVTLVPVDDRMVEGDETAILNVAAGGGYLVTGSPASGTITDNDTATLSFTSGTSTAVESIGTHNINATLTLNAIGTGTIGLASNVTANLTSTGGTATAGGTDYTLPTNPALTFAAGTYASGTATQNAAIGITDDRLVEGNETAGFGLSIAQNIGTQVSLGGTTAHTLTISDNDTATIGFAASSSNPLESVGTHNVGVTLTINATGTGSIGLASSLTADLTNTGGTATGGGTDYTLPTSPAVTFAAGTYATGMATQNAAISIVDDRSVEGSETIGLGLGITQNIGTQASVGGTTGHNVTIADNDTATIVFSGFSPSITEGGSIGILTLLQINATGTGTIQLDRTVSVTIQDLASSTATGGGVDYTHANNTITYNPGAVNNQAGVSSIISVDDRLVEGTESIDFLLGGLVDGTNGQVALSGTLAKTLQLTDNDTATLSFDSGTSSASEAVGTHNVSATLTINATGTGTIGLASAVTANVTATGGSATSGTDYTLPGNPALTFAAGSYATGTATQNVGVTVINDRTVEGNETAALGLSIAQNIGTQVSLGATTSHTVTIADDDFATIGYVTTSSNVGESAGSDPLGLVLHINATGTGTAMLGQSATVNVTATGGTATGGGTDYTLPGAVTFAAGSVDNATQTANLAIIDDALVEGNETVNLGLAIGTDNTGGQITIATDTSASHVTTILDNDIDLQVKVAAPAGPVVAGSGSANLPFIVTVTNNSFIDATNVTLHELFTLPGGVSFTSANPSQGTADGSDWHLGTLAVGGTATLELDLTADHSTAHNALASATISLSSADQSLVNTADDIDTKSATIVRHADLGVTITDMPDPTVPSQPLMYTITVTNHGPSDNTTANIDDIFPALLTNVTWTALFSSGGTGHTGGAGDLHEAFSLPADGTAVYTVTGTVSGSASATNLSDTVTISSSEDGNNANDTATTATTIGGVDLKLTQDDHVTSAAPGDLIQYVLTYQNGGFVTSTGVKITDAVPANTVFDAAHSTAGWTGVVDGSAAGTIGTFNIGTVGTTDAPANVTFAVRVLPVVSASAGIVVNQATIADDGANGADIHLADNTALESDLLVAAPDLALTVAVDKSVIVRGQTLHYTYSYSNHGNQDTTGAFITATVPVGTHFNLAESNPAWSQTGPSTYEFDIAALPAGQTPGSVVFAVDVNTFRTPGLRSIDSHATIDDAGSNGVDPNLADNTATSSTTLYEGIYAFAQSRPGGAIGVGKAPVVKLVDITTGATSSFLAYERSYTNGVRIAVGDMNGDGFLDVVTATRDGSGRIRVFDGLTHELIPIGDHAQINAFTGAAAHGAYVALSDVNGDGRLDIVAGSGLGGGAVKVFDGRTGSLLETDTPFGRTYHGGLRVAGGDVNGDGLDDIVAGQSALGSKVAVIFGGEAHSQLVFTAGSAHLRDGVFVATGDTQGDGVADIIVGRGAQGGRGGASIGIFEVNSGFTLAPTPTATEVKTIALNSSIYRYGARVAVADLNFDGVADIIAAAGPLGRSRVQAFEGDGVSLTIDPTIAFPASPTLGLFVAAGNPPEPTRKF